MKTKSLVLLLGLLMSFPFLHGQKIKVAEGKISSLEGIDKLKIEYDYSNLAVGKFDVEQDYIDKKVAEKNEEEAGSGDKWKEAWFNDRPTRFEPKFEELFTKYAAFIQSGQDVDAEVRMHIHTTFIEPGYNVAVSRKPASVNLEISFIRGDKVMAKVLVLNSPGSGGMGYDFDAGYRIQESYAKAGKALAKYLDKQLN